MATINRGGITMVISPAKTLDLKKISERSDEMELDYDTIATLSAAASAHSTKSMLCDQDKTRTIVNILKKKSEAELKTLLSLSPSLAKTAHEYWSNFSLESSDNNNIKKKNDHFAIFTFNGPAYQGISANTCNKSTLSYMSKNLFILDPVYGVLRSLDTMQPYRLEMGVKGIVANDNSSKPGKKETLASYWKDSITSYLGKELINNNKSSSAPSILANLASDEYSSSIDISSLPPNTIYLNIIFRHQGRVLSVHAKKARGLMARYLSQTNAQTLEDIANFNLENYNCVPIKKDEKWEVIDVVGDNVQIMKMIFDRSEAPPKNKAAAGKRSNASAASTKQGGKKTKKKK